MNIAGAARLIMTYNVGTTGKFEYKPGSFSENDWNLTEQIGLLPVDPLIHSYYTGVTSVDRLYSQSKSIATKIAFALDRGYEPMAVKYGVGISNPIFETLYVFIIPRNEKSEVVKNVYGIPANQRINFSLGEVDFDDQLLLIGIGNT